MSLFLKPHPQENTPTSIAMLFVECLPKDIVQKESLPGERSVEQWPEADTTQINGNNKQSWGTERLPVTAVSPLHVRCSGWIGKAQFCSQRI